MDTHKILEYSSQSFMPVLPILKFVTISAKRANLPVDGVITGVEGIVWEMKYTQLNITARIIL
jgi:hypothetical protein